MYSKEFTKSILFNKTREQGGKQVSKTKKNRNLEQLWYHCNTYTPFQGDQFEG